MTFSAVMRKTYIFEDVGSLGQLKTPFVGSLAIILHHQVIWYCDTVALFGRAHTCQRSLHYPVFKCDGAELEGSEQACVLERLEAWWGICFRHAGRMSGSKFCVCKLRMDEEFKQGAGEHRDLMEYTMYVLELRVCLYGACTA